MRPSLLIRQHHPAVCVAPSQTSFGRPSESPAKKQGYSGSTCRSRRMGEKSKRKTRNVSNTTARHTLAVAEDFQLLFAAVGQHQFAAVVELGKPEIFIDQRLVESEVPGRLGINKSDATSRPCRRSGLLSSSPHHRQPADQGSRPSASGSRPDHLRPRGHRRSAYRAPSASGPGVCAC